MIGTDNIQLATSLYICDFCEQGKQAQKGLKAIPKALSAPDSSGYPAAIARSSSEWLETQSTIARKKLHRPPK